MDEHWSSVPYIPHAATPQASFRLGCLPRGGMNEHWGRTNTGAGTQVYHMQLRRRPRFLQSAVPPPGGMKEHWSRDPWIPHAATPQASSSPVDPSGVNEHWNRDLWIPHAATPQASSSPIDPSGVNEHWSRDPCILRGATPQASFSLDASSAGPPTVSAEAYQVSQLIDFDGWFSPSAELARIVGSEILQKGDELRVDGRLWATLVAVAYLKKHLEKEPYLLDTILEKTGDFVRKTQARERGNLQGDFEDMVRHVSKLLEEEQGIDQ
ncbi:hypothetical protein BKA82DRAFT_27054 [Pisolithus tinctorius]|uniref:Uncharacterized protein n=1 Tax=Pisolithus tinctorius Marx 270 TaxID=870435 RepID=A0A0C3K1K6_PISTI|nr:hypothetical protein BKA82DRAFT_27054 [Pisolithus tinctorius]KIO03412.1 hypothetical protein M404DRAFT_27054 [Pisolithus tinctorius Marx 270]